jgi:L-lysine exporter family protein LysE/ArgO
VQRHVDGGAGVQQDDPCAEAGLGELEVAEHGPAHPGEQGLHAQQTPLLPTVLTASALTWLNPHVYLDTVILLGSVAATQGDLRWHFGAGAAVGSLLWFTALGVGARLLRPVFARPVAWRVLDGAIALVMVVLAAGLVSGG